MQSCRIGAERENEPCHGFFSRSVECFVNLSQTDADEIKLLGLRLDMTLTADDTVCKHHFIKYGSGYASQQRQCADPGGLHKRACKSE